MQIHAPEFHRAIQAAMSRLQADTDHKVVVGYRLAQGTNFHGHISIRAISRGPGKEYVIRTQAEQRASIESHFPADHIEKHAKFIDRFIAREIHYLADENDLKHGETIVYEMMSVDPITGPAFNDSVAITLGIPRASDLESMNAEFHLVA